MSDTMSVLDPASESDCLRPQNLLDVWDDVLQATACPTCGAAVDERCRGVVGGREMRCSMHTDRIRSYEERSS